MRIRGIGRIHEVRKGVLPEAQICSDFLTIAPFLIMPSVWPIPASSSVDLVTWTSEGMIIGIISLRIGMKELIQRVGLSNFWV